MDTHAKKFTRHKLLIWQGQGSDNPGKPGKMPLFLKTQGKPRKLREILKNKANSWKTQGKFL